MPNGRGTPDDKEIYVIELESVSPDDAIAHIIRLLPLKLDFLNAEPKGMCHHKSARRFPTRKRHTIFSNF